jgi:hypothetical protein
MSIDWLVLAHDADAPADVRPQPAQNQNQPMIEKTKSTSRVGIALVGAFATIAGIGEIVVGLTGLLGHLGAQHSAGDFDGHYRRLLQSGRPLDLDHEKIGAALGILLIACEVLGRLYLVMIGIAPSTGGDAIKISLAA